MNFFYAFNNALGQIFDFVVPVIPFAILFSIFLIFILCLISRFVRFIRRRFICKEKEDNYLC